MLANAVAATFYLLMSKQIIVFGKMSFFASLPLMLLFFGVTELLPMLSFAKMENQLVKIEFGELNA